MLPLNVAQAGSHTIYPLLRGCPPEIAVFSARAKGVARGGMFRYKVPPAGDSDRFPRASRRRLEKMIAKGRPVWDTSRRTGGRTMRRVVEPV